MQPLIYAIAITGGIGTGKSTACNLLKLYGYSIIDADKIAHSMLEYSKNEIIQIFGKEILLQNTTNDRTNTPSINRKKLAKIVFNDKEKLKKLEHILHPKIREKIMSEALVLESYKKPYFVDIPLFFETKETTPYPISQVLLIYAPQEIQLKRLMKRDNLDYKEAQLRIQAQMNIEAKKSLSTYIIENTKDLAFLQAQIKDFLDKISGQ